MIRLAVFLDIAGWVGATVVTVAYGLVSSGLADGQSRTYQSLNALAGLLLAANTAWHRAWPSAVVNVIWTGIALGALAVCGTRRRAAAREQTETRGRAPRAEGLGRHLGMDETAEVLGPVNVQIDAQARFAARRD